MIAFQNEEDGSYYFHWTDVKDVRQAHVNEAKMPTAGSSLCECSKNDLSSSILTCCLS